MDSEDAGLLSFDPSSTEKWDIRFLQVCQLVAGWSKDPNTQVGAVIVGPERDIVSTGFNGFPRGIPDDPEHYACRETKLDRIIHAEMNALLRARGSLRGHTLYTYPLLSCNRCAVHVIQTGISAVVSVELEGELRERWQGSLDKSLDMFSQAGVHVRTYSKNKL